MQFLKGAFNVAPRSRTTPCLRAVSEGCPGPVDFARGASRILCKCPSSFPSEFVFEAARLFGADKLGTGDAKERRRENPLHSVATRLQFGGTRRLPPLPRCLHGRECAGNFSGWKTNLDPVFDLFPFSCFVVGAVLKSNVYWWRQAYEAATLLFICNPLLFFIPSLLVQKRASAYIKMPQGVKKN